SSGAVLTFDPPSSAPMSTTFGLDLHEAVLDLAVGADGSLYVARSESAGPSLAPRISRIAPGGTVLWTSVDLATLEPAYSSKDNAGPSLVALGEDDLVVDVINVPVRSTAIVLALDPATGTVRWSTPLSGTFAGGPMIRSDGAIVTLLGNGGA